MKKWILILSFLMTANAWSLQKDKTQVQAQVFDLQVTEDGFQPKSLDVKTNTPTVLNVTRKTNSTCATQIQVPSLRIKKDLPLNQMVSIDIGKLKKGEIRFGCGMNMMDAGIIHVK